MVGLMRRLHGLSRQLMKGDGILNGGISMGVNSICLWHNGQTSGTRKHVILVPFSQCWKHSMGSFSISIEGCYLMYILFTKYK